MHTSENSEILSDQILEVYGLGLNMELSQLQNWLLHTSEFHLSTKSKSIHCPTQFIFLPSGLQPFKT